MPETTSNLKSENKNALRTAAAFTSVCLLSCLLVRNLIAEAMWNIAYVSPWIERATVSVSAAAGFIVMTLVLTKAPRKPFVKNDDLNTKTVLSLFCVLLALCVLSRAASAVFSDVLWRFGVQFDTGSMPTAPEEFWIWAINAVLVAPIMEEMAFRGALMPCLNRFGTKFSLCAVTILFALFHIAPTAWPNALLVGGFIGAAVVFTGSLAVGIMLHISNNLISLFEMILWESSSLCIPAIRLFAAAIMLVLGIIGGYTLFKTAPVNEQNETDTAKTLGMFFFNMPMLLVAAVFVMLMMEAAI